MRLFARRFVRRHPETGTIALVFIISCLFVAMTQAFMLCGVQSFLIILGVQPQWYILMLGLIVVLASLADRTLTRLALKK